jgi:redox-sensing transcriptional repressor
MVFDNDPGKIGQQIGSFVIEDAATMTDRIREAGIKIVMLTVPASAAQEITDRLVKVGVRAILNYAPLHLVVPEGVRVQHIDPSIHLQRMTFYL